MCPLSAVQFSPVTRPCYLRSCPNGPRFDQREITRMMSLLSLSDVSLPCNRMSVIGATTNIGLREGQIGSQRLTQRGH
jgi:hypothetical protein